MNTAPPDAAMTTAIAATEQSRADAAPRLKLLSHGFAIDHPDPELGEQLMANALGVTGYIREDGRVIRDMHLFEVNHRRNRNTRGITSRRSRPSLVTKRIVRLLTESAHS